MSCLQLKHIFGLKGDVRDNIHYIDETNVCYPAGYNIVAYNIEKKTQRFIPLTNTQQTNTGNNNNVNNGNNGTNNTGNNNNNNTGVINPTSSDSVIPQSGGGDISAIAMSTLKHSHAKGKVLAVAERGDGMRAQVSVFDLNTFKKKGKSVITSNEVASKEYVSMCFSPDGKYLLTQGGAPDWTLVNWQWEKGKALQLAKVSNQSGAPIHQCSYCPTDPTVVCVTGNGILRFLHLEQNEFKSIPFSMGKREPQNYLCHCWIDDRILVGTDTGDILVFENAEFRGVLESSPSDGKSIDSIAAFSKGFVCGCDEGVLYVFERDEKEIYKQSKSFQIDGNYCKIKNIAISPSEENVTCTLDNNQAFVLGLSNTDILKTEEMNFEPLALPFHHLQITGLDVCIRKPLVVTCGMDRSVRVWNYLTRTIEVMKFFNEQPHSVAFHPSGLHILVGFTDSLRLINLLMDELRPFKDFTIKGCRECQFSNGGQYFAAANGSVIQIFSTYTCDMLGSFNVHKGKVRSLHWIHDDSAIISAGMDGSVYMSKLKDGSHISATKQKCNYSCAVGTSDGKMFAVGSDKQLKLMVDSQVVQEFNAGIVLTQICLLTPRPPIKDRVLFAGTDTGVVRTFPLPIEGKCYDIQVHSGPITRMRVSPDDNYLFTVSEDGTLAIFTIENRDSGPSSPSRRSRHELMLPFAEEILVTKSDLEEKVNLMNELQNKVEELQNHNELQLQLREHTYREKLRDVTEKFNNELEANKQRYRSLEEEKDIMEKQYAHKVEQLNALQHQKLEDLNHHHKAKLATEEERYHELEAKMATDHEHWDEQTQLREDRFEKEKEMLTAEYKAKITAERERRARIAADKNGIVAEFEETKQLMEEDADHEIDELKASYDKKLNVERMTTLRLKDQNAILKRKFGALKDDIQENLDDLVKMKEKQQALYADIDSLEKDIKGHIKEIKERESTIADKVHRIFELKKKNQELEKFKFVLDYKITELKRQIQPRKLEMNAMSEQIAQMQTELKGYKKQSAHLQLAVKELNLKLNGMEKEIEFRLEDREQVEAHLKRFKTELHQVYQSIEDSKLLKDGIKRLYQRHVQSEWIHGTKQGGADDMHKDYQRQRHYLERSVDSLNAKLKKDMHVHKKDNARIMQENIALIKEINQLRREIQTMRANQKAKDLSKKTVRKSRPAATDSDQTKRLSMEREMEMQQEQIRALKAQLQLFEHDLQAQDMIYGGGGGGGATQQNTSYSSHSRPTTSDQRLLTPMTEGGPDYESTPVS